MNNEEKHTHFKRVVVAKCFAPDSNVEFPVVFKADEPLKTETNVSLSCEWLQFWHLHDVNDDDHTDDDDWDNYDDKGNGDIDNEIVYLSSP